MLRAVHGNLNNHRVQLTGDLDKDGEQGHIAWDMFLIYGSVGRGPCPRCMYLPRSRQTRQIYISPVAQAKQDIETQGHNFGYLSSVKKIRLEASRLRRLVSPESFFFSANC